MQPYAGGAGTAVESERHRPARGVLAVGRIGGEEHLRLGLRSVELVVSMVLLAQHDPPRSGRIAQLAVVESDRVPGGNQVIDWFAGLAVAILLVAVVRLVLGRVGHGSTVSG